MPDPIDKPRKILAVVDTSEAQIALKTAAPLAETDGATPEAIACVEPPHDLSILSRLPGEHPDRMIKESVARAEVTVLHAWDATAEGKVWAFSNSTDSAWPPRTMSTPSWTTGARR